MYNPKIVGIIYLEDILQHNVEFIIILMIIIYCLVFFLENVMLIEEIKYSTFNQVVK